MQYILNVSYDVVHAPLLDHFIFVALENYSDNADCIRDDFTRNLYFYLESSQDLLDANNLLQINGAKIMGTADEKDTLLDFITISAKEKNEMEELKIKTRERIDKIYQKHMED